MKVFEMVKVLYIQYDIKFGKSNMMKIIKYYLAAFLLGGMTLCVLSSPVWAEQEKKLVTKHQSLIDVFGCQVVPESVICLSEISRLKNSPIVVYKFRYEPDINVNTDIDSGVNKIFKLIFIVMKYYSSQINPVTAKFFGENKKPSLAYLIHEQDAKKIVISIKTYLHEKIYTSYLFPIITDGQIRMVSGSHTGDKDVFSIMLEDCRLKDIENLFSDCNWIYKK